MSEQFASKDEYYLSIIRKHKATIEELDDLVDELIDWVQGCDPYPESQDWAEAEEIIDKIKESRE